MLAVDKTDRTRLSVLGRGKKISFFGIDFRHWSLNNLSRRKTVEPVILNFIDCHRESPTYFTASMVIDFAWLEQTAQLC